MPVAYAPTDSREPHPGYSEHRLLTRAPPRAALACQHAARTKTPPPLVIPEHWPRRASPPRPVGRFKAYPALIFQDPPMKVSPPYDMETLSPIQVLSQPCAPRGIFQLHVIATGPETPCA